MNVDPSPDAVAALRRDLLAWFAASRRDLPWRRRRTLYGTWIAEVMLQQTTVAAVVPYWERFLDRFPDVGALARADEAEVLSLWSGLGYYRRARQLHAAARLVRDERGGRLPRDRDGWLALPGIGPYAAGAIASMALDEVVPALDANARRVLLRWVCDAPRAAAALRPADLAALGDALVPRVAPGDWNEAVMELGALVCRAREPRCDACPVRGSCLAGSSGRAAEIPPPARRAAPTPVCAGAIVVHDDRRVLLVPASRQPTLVPSRWGRPARRELRNLHGGLWGPPLTAWYRGRPPLSAGWSAWLRDAGLTGAPRPAGRIRHAITRWRLDIAVFSLRVGDGDLRRLADASGGRVAPCDAPPPLSRMAVKIIRKAGMTIG